MWLSLLFLVIATIRILAVSDLHEGDQPKQMDYVLDIVCNGNWTVQHHADGSIMSKPPLYNWLAAPCVMLFGPEDVFLKMPSLLAGFAALLMVWDLARRRLGDRAAFWGSAFMLFTTMYTKQLYYARTDMLLTCFIVAQFWAIIRWEDSDSGSEKSSFRSGWIWTFWIAAALGNLSKGPLAFLPHVALIAYWYFDGTLKEKYARLGLWWGLPLAWLPLLVWFGFAYRAEGYAVYEHMVKAEVVARFQSEADRAALKGTDKSNRNFFYYIPHVIARTAPWSLFALLGIWSAVTAKKNPSITDRERRMLTFLSAWFFCTLLIFSVVPSKRADRIFPAIPAFCLLAGWAFDGLLNWMEGTIPDRIELKISRWIAVAISILLFVISLGLAGMLLMPTAGIFKSIQRVIPSNGFEHISSVRTFTVIGVGVLLSSALMAMGHYIKKKANAMATRLLVCNVALIILYQFYFGSWMQTDISTGAPQVCREVRTRARTENVPVMLITGCGPTSRFYLLKSGLATPAKEAAERLAKPHPAMYVIGTQPSFNGKNRIEGGLIDAGLGDLQPLPIPNAQPIAKTDSKLPTIPPLAAVFVPERK